ncbi:MAG: hypothetical protein WCO66_02810 [Candidatus Absconditabacteria bacterium]
MNTFEEVKKIKWIIRELREELTKNGVSTRFASLYRENDEDIEIWNTYCKAISKEQHYCSLVLFAAEIKCDYFQVLLTIGEDYISIKLEKYQESGQMKAKALEFEFEESDSARTILRNIDFYLCWGFKSTCNEDYSDAYDRLLNDLSKTS